MKAISDYLSSIDQALKAGNATEHTHRPALKTLVEALRPKIIATNEPTRIACGAPDYIVSSSDIPLGYIEAKDVGINLDKVEEGSQLGRYRGSLRNLILTDYLEFRLYRNGELVDTVNLAKWLKTGVLRKQADAEPKLIELFSAFFDAEVPSVASSEELAERMARLARLLHDIIVLAFKNEDQAGDLHAQHEAFKRVLINELTPDQFADMYAQTIAYGLFAARCNHTSAGFSRQQAGHYLPRTNPFLRRLFNTIAGPDLDDRIAWVVDDLSHLLSRADIEEILEDFGKVTGREDPIVHFYETFLAAYDPKLRELRGVYYTPEQVVGYIVRSVDQLIKKDFKMKDGLADASLVKMKTNRMVTTGKYKGKVVEETYDAHRLQILDPACGTGTFLHSVVDHIRARFEGNAGLWPGYVTQHLLPRLYGFELLMAPYAIAHMKLGLQLKDSGYDFASPERLRVFLTNTLEEAHEMTGLPLFTQWLAEEAAAAGEVKQNAPIMVVIGNPPYSGHSANKGDWIKELLSEYKKSPELKKPAQAKWLSDDYVKFIRFSQWKIEQTGYGILAFITNHSYLSNPTFLDMRSSLMSTFDDLYFLDLHGSSKPREHSPDGTSDKNVFDIQKGVAIALLVRRTTRAKSSTVYRADLWGGRSSKYAWLAQNDVSTTKWENITPQQSPWLFVKQDADLSSEYKKGWSVTEIFAPNGDPAPGVVTTHDEFAISWSREDAIDKVEQLLATATEGDARQLFSLCKQNQWDYKKAKEALSDGHWKERVVPILYRPFDIRWTVWNSHVAVHRRERVFSHMLERDNLALLTSRGVEAGPWDHAFVGSGVAGHHCVSIKEVNYALPLWLYPIDAGFLVGSEAARIPNISAETIAYIEEYLGIKDWSPEAIFYYVYACLYSPAYRIKYANVMRREFPRVPQPETAEKFHILSELGSKLVSLHLMKDQKPLITDFPKAGSNKVEAFKFVPEISNGDTGSVWINDKQFFSKMPIQVWEYSIGSYQVAAKWLKDRKGRLLTFNDLQHYGQIVSCLDQTIKVQQQIDGLLYGDPS